MHRSSSRSPSSWTRSRCRYASTSHANLLVSKSHSPWAAPAAGFVAAAAAASDSVAVPVFFVAPASPAVLSRCRTCHCRMCSEDPMNVLKCTPSYSLPGRPHPQSSRHAGFIFVLRSRFASLLIMSYACFAPCVSPPHHRHVQTNRCQPRTVGPKR